MHSPHSSGAGPKAFLGSPSLPRVGSGQPARVVEVAAPVVKPALLTVDARGKAYISSALSQALGVQRLRNGIHLELFPSRARNGGVWRLELRAADAYPTLSQSRGSLPTFRSGSVLSPRHFQVAGQPGVLYTRIALQLVSVTPDAQGFYHLRPNHAYSTQG